MGCDGTTEPALTIALATQPQFYSDLPNFTAVGFLRSSQRKQGILFDLLLLILITIFKNAIISKRGPEVLGHCV